MDINQIIKSHENVDELINDTLQTTADNEDMSDKVQLDNDGIVLFQFPSGNALTLRETYDITATEKTKIVVLIGPSACGKTTIETTLYQMFQNGKIGDYYFAGSKTIQGYEQRSYYTRTRSNQTMPMTPRTSRGVRETFLHLKTWNCKKNKYQNYLFADLSGEYFETHIADTSAMQKDFQFIKSVDYIVAVLDGNLISDKKNRNGTFEEMAQLLRTICDAELYTIRTNLQVVISKYDIVEKNASQDPTIETFITRIKCELRQRLKQYFNSIDFYNVAAMPNNNIKFEVGYGIKELMDSWSTKNCSTVLQINHNERKKFMSSEFNKLNEKILGDRNE